MLKCDIMNKILAGSLLFISMNSWSYPFFDEYLQVWPFLPMDAVEDAATIASLEAFSGLKMHGIYDLNSPPNISLATPNSVELCSDNGRQDIVQSTLMRKCVLIKNANIEKQIWNELFEKYNIQRCDIEKECRILKVDKLIFDNKKIRNILESSIRYPCSFLTKPQSSFKKQAYPFQLSGIDYAWRILDCESEKPEAYNIIVDEETRSIIALRIKKSFYYHRYNKENGDK